MFVKVLVICGLRIFGVCQYFSILHYALSDLGGWFREAWHGSFPSLFSRDRERAWRAEVSNNKMRIYVIVIVISNSKN